MVVIPPDNRNMAATKAEMESMFSNLSLKQSIRYLEPGTYMGLSTENAADWLDRFENYAKLNELDNKKKIITFQLLLKGASSCWFKSLSSTDITNFDTIVKKFKETFMSPSKNWINIQRLETRKLLPTETCEHYINETLSISNQIGLTAKEISQALIRGLPGKIRAQIITFNPSTLDETIQRIYLAEAAIKLQQKEELTVVEEPSNPQLAAITSAIERVNDSVNNNSSLINKLPATQETYRRTFIPREEKDYGQPIEEQGARQPQSDWNRQRTWISRPMNRLQCFTCGSENHLYKQCPMGRQRRQIEPRNRQWNMNNQYGEQRYQNPRQGQEWNRNTQYRPQNQQRLYNNNEQYSRGTKNIMFPRRF